MTLEIHNWWSSVHQEIHKILKDEIFPIVNQVDARLQNFKIQFLKEAAKFIRDLKSLANEADESLDKQKKLIDPHKTSKEDKFVPINNVRASVRTNPITVSQPYVISKIYVNSDSNGLSSIRVDNTAKTRRL
ncbi:hypothetical protein Tco_0665820 [Tanacetum coccineum]